MWWLKHQLKITYHIVRWMDKHSHQKIFKSALNYCDWRTWAKLKQHFKYIRHFTILTDRSADKLWISYISIKTSAVLSYYYEMFILLNCCFNFRFESVSKSFGPTFWLFVVNLCLSTIKQDTLLLSLYFISSGPSPQSYRWWPLFSQPENESKLNIYTHITLTKFSKL